jgi:hypothetical protein
MNLLRLHLKIKAVLIFTIALLASGIVHSQTPTLIYSQSFQASGIGTGSIEPVSINTLAGNKRVKIITTCTERIHSPLLARNYVGYQIGIRAMIH